MFFWYIATAVFAVGWVFRDARFDYRLLIVGSVLPLIDGLFGGARALYSVVTAIAVLVVVMLATIGRRPLRKVLLGLPIGMILHLVFSAAWDDTDVFWWPLTGWSIDGDPPLPVVRPQGLYAYLCTFGICCYRECMPGMYSGSGTCLACHASCKTCDGSKVLDI